VDGMLWWLHPVTWVGLFLIGPIVGAWIGVWYLAAWWSAAHAGTVDRDPDSGDDRARRGVVAVDVGGLATGGFPWLPLAASQWQRTSVSRLRRSPGPAGWSFVLLVVNIGFASVRTACFNDRQTGCALRRPIPVRAVPVMVCVSVHVQWRSTVALLGVAGPRRIRAGSIPQKVNGTRAGTSHLSDPAGIHARRQTAIPISFVCGGEHALGGAG